MKKLFNISFIVLFILHTFTFPSYAQDATSVGITSGIGDNCHFTLPKNNGILICIDPGHQGNADFGKEPVGPGSSELKTRVSSGTQGCITGKAESLVNLEIGLQLEEELKSRGYTVVMTRTTQDVQISNVERAQIANNNSADAYIRLHCDANGSSYLEGISVLVPSLDNPYCGDIAQSCQNLGESILNSTIIETGANNRGIHIRNDLSGTNWSKVPVALIEMGFMTNPKEDQLLNSLSYQNSLVIGIANGIDSYFGR